MPAKYNITQWNLRVFRLRFLFLISFRQNQGRHSATEPRYVDPTVKTMSTMGRISSQRARTIDFVSIIRFDW